VKQVIITHHAHDRMKERVGIPVSAHEKAASKAWNDGARNSDVSGALRRFLDALSHRYPGKSIRVYSEKAWCFDGGGILITVINLPRKYVNAANRVMESRKQNQ